jgi:hypothetical protein
MPLSPFLFRLAAPSWLIPATVEENVRHLLDNCAAVPEVEEVALLLFETEAALFSTNKDLPTSLRDAGFTWHVHLPLDIPWELGGVAAYETASRLADKTEFLNPRFFVLHPPPESRDGMQLSQFAQLWRMDGRNTEQILVENTQENDLVELLPRVEEEDLRLCLDMGHVLAYGQDALLEALEGRWDLVRLLHLHGFGPVRDTGKLRDHQSLDLLDEEGWRQTEHALRSVCEATSLPPTVVLEVFQWEGFERSVSLLRERFREG